MVAISNPLGISLAPIGGRFPLSSANPDAGSAGRKSSTLSESTIAAFAASRCVFQTGPPSEPDKSVRIVDVSELTYHSHPNRLLGLDELSIKEVDKSVTLSWVEGVLPEFYNRAAILFRTLAGWFRHRVSLDSGSDAWANTYRQPVAVRTYVSLNHRLYSNGLPSSVPLAQSKAVTTAVSPHTRTFWLESS